MYSKESDAYSRIVSQSERTGNESMVVLTDGGTLVLPDYKNTSTSVDIRDYGYSTKNGNIVDAAGTTHNTIATAHTHPSGNGPSTHTVRNYGDLGFASLATPYKPVYVLQMNGANIVSFVLSRPNLDFSTAVDMNLTKHDPNITPQNLINGKVSLRQFTINNIINFLNALNE